MTGNTETIPNLIKFLNIRSGLGTTRPHQAKAYIWLIEKPSGERRSRSPYDWKQESGNGGIRVSQDVIRSKVWEVVDQLSRGDYESAIRQCAKSRLTEADLRRVIHDHGRTLVIPPPTAYENLDAVRVKDATEATFSVRAPLWTAEGGRSNLTLELTVVLESTSPKIVLDDLHVL